MTWHTNTLWSIFDRAVVQNHKRKFCFDIEKYELGPVQSRYFSKTSIFVLQFQHINIKRITWKILTLIPYTPWNYEPPTNVPLSSQLPTSYARVFIVFGPLYYPGLKAKYLWLYKVKNGTCSDIISKKKVLEDHWSKIAIILKTSIMSTHSHTLCAFWEIGFHSFPFLDETITETCVT